MAGEKKLIIVQNLPRQYLMLFAYAHGLETIIKNYTVLSNSSLQMFKNFNFLFLKHQLLSTLNIRKKV